MICKLRNRLTHCAVQAAVSLCVLSIPVAAQSDPHPQDTAPPPLKIISRLDREQIDREKDPKDRVKATLGLAETHLAGGELKTTQQDYDGAAAEVGKYWALIEDAFAFMKTMKGDNNKTRDLYKRIELALRAHGPRLSLIRRSTPVQHAVWIKQIEENARMGRTEALNSFYGHTVVRDQKPSSANEPRKQNERRPGPEGVPKNP
jgi:hypothetical protein